MGLLTIFLMLYYKFFGKLNISFPGGKNLNGELQTRDSDPLNDPDPIEGDGYPAENVYE